MTPHEFEPSTVWPETCVKCGLHKKSVLHRIGSFTALTRVPSLRRG